MHLAQFVHRTAIAIIGALACSWAGAEYASTAVVLETEIGPIEIEVFEDAAPLSSGSFLAFVDLGYLDGGSFYRTVSPGNDHGHPLISAIQGGTEHSENHPPPVAHETTEMTGVRHVDGTVSLARGEVGTASGAAFFICIGDQPGLDYGGTRHPDGQGFAAFGKVISGMEVVHAIHRREAAGPSDSPYTEGQMLSEPVRILSARRKP